MGNSQPQLLDIHIDLCKKLIYLGVDSEGEMQSRDKLYI